MCLTNRGVVVSLSTSKAACTEAESFYCLHRRRHGWNKYYMLLNTLKRMVKALVLCVCRSERFGEVHAGQHSVQVQSQPKILHTQLWREDLQNSQTAHNQPWLVHTHGRKVMLKLMHFTLYFLTLHAMCSLIHWSLLIQVYKKKLYLSYLKLNYEAVL